MHNHQYIHQSAYFNDQITVHDAVTLMCHSVCRHIWTEPSAALPPTFTVLFVLKNSQVGLYISTFSVQQATAIVLYHNYLCLSSRHFNAPMQEASDLAFKIQDDVNLQHKVVD